MSHFVPEKVFLLGVLLHYFNMKKTAAESHRILVEDCCHTQEELAESLGVTQAAISKRLTAAGYIQKQGNWVPHELKPRDVGRRFCMSEMLLERHKKKPAQFFWDGIHKLSERWEKVIASDGQ